MLYGAAAAAASTAACQIGGCRIVNAAAAIQCGFHFVFSHKLPLQTQLGNAGETPAEVLWCCLWASVPRQACEVMP
jgi:hypothetical protein